MKSDVFFTIVIPTYNRAALIRKSIASVLAQKYPHFEVIVVDDGSTDGTQSVLNEIHDTRLNWLTINNSERGAARNVGIRMSRGSYVTFLDSDDVLYPCHLELVYEKLRESGLPEVYHQGYAIVDGNGSVLERTSNAADLAERLFTEGNVMSCMGVFVRRDVIIENLFNENRLLAGLEDWELWIRLAAKYRITSDARVTSALVQHAERSSMRLPSAELERKCNLFLEIVLGNVATKNKYGSLFNRLTGSVYTYLSLHLSLTANRKPTAWKYFFAAIRRDRYQLVRKRSLVIIRNLLFKK